MVESRRKPLCASAIAHVHPNDIAAGAPKFVRVSDHVLRVRRSFKTVNDDDRWPLRPDLDWLEVAVAKHVASWATSFCRGDLDEVGHRRWEPVVTAQKIPNNRLKVAVAQVLPGMER